MKRYFALLLAGLLVLSLAACGPAAADPSAPPVSGGPQAPSGTPAPTATPTPAPDGGDASPIPDRGTPPPLEDTPAVDILPSGDDPSPTPVSDPTSVATPEPTPSPAPVTTPEPTPSAAPVAVTAQTVYDAVAAAAQVSYDDASDYMDAFYFTDSADLADYVFYQPAMSEQLEEIFVAKCAPGRQDAVKQACLERQEAMAEESALYGSNGAYVSGYKLVTQGDWLLFCVCKNADAAVSAFQNAAK